MQISLWSASRKQTTNRNSINRKGSSPHKQASNTDPGPGQTRSVNHPYECPSKLLRATK